MGPRTELTISSDIYQADLSSFTLTTFSVLSTLILKSTSDIRWITLYGPKYGGSRLNFAGSFSDDMCDDTRAVQKKKVV